MAQTENEINRNVSIDVGTDNTVLCDTRNTLVNRRIFFSIINISTAGQEISISVSDEAGANKGIVLDVGGSYVESRDSNFEPTNNRICAVSSAASGKVAVCERLQVL